MSEADGKGGHWETNDAGSQDWVDDKKDAEHYRTDHEEAVA